MAPGQTGGKRNANMDILRLISMIMVTMLHALTKSDLLPALGYKIPVNGWIAWILEVSCVSSVNIFMLISGYFLISSTFKTRRLAELIFQAFFYSAGGFMILLLFGKLSSESMNLYELLPYFLPIHMETYWFLSAYVILYLLLPLIVSGVQTMSEKHLQGVIFWLLIFSCVTKSILPVRLTMDNSGYSFLWYLTLFLVGARIRLYGFKVLKTARRGWYTFLISTFLILAEIILLSQVQSRTGRLKEMTTVSLEYNHIFVFLSAVGIFAAFLHMEQFEGKVGKWAFKLSPYCLGVYLLQESPVIRYWWQDWFGLREIMGRSTPVFLFRVLGSVIAMFTLGIFTDMLQSVLFRSIVHFVCRKDKVSC